MATMACLRSVGDVLAADDGAVLLSVEVGEKRPVGGVDLGGLGLVDRLLVGELSEVLEVLSRGRRQVQAQEDNPGHDPQDDDRDEHENDDRRPAAVSPRSTCPVVAGRSVFDARSSSPPIYVAPRSATIICLGRNRHAHDSDAPTSKPAPRMRKATAPKPSQVEDATPSKHGRRICLDHLHTI